MRRDDQAPLAPRLARTVGAQKLGNGFDRRLDGQHVEPDTGEMPAFQQIGERIDIADRPARRADYHASFRHALQHRPRDHAARFQRQRRMDRQRVGLLHQRLERAYALDADAELGAVRHVRVVGNDAELESLCPQRRRRADAAEADDAEGLHTVAPQQRIADVAPRRGLRPPLRLEMERDAAAKRQSERERMVGHLGGAVVRHVAHHDVASCGSLAIDLIVAHTHAQNAGELGKLGKVFGGYPEPQRHQAVDVGAILVLELRQIGDVAPHHAHVGPEHLAFDLVVVVEFLGIEHRLDHGLGIPSVTRPILAGVHRVSTRVRRWRPHFAGVVFAQPGLPATYRAPASWWVPDRKGLTS